MKIVYIMPSLERFGGTERIVIEKANYFTHNFGYEVYIITLFQLSNTSNCYLLSDKVQQINLNVPYFSQYKYGYPKRLWKKIAIYFNMRKIITQTIHKIDPDIMIGVCYFKADMISTINCKAKKIIECHVPKSLRISSLYKTTTLNKFYTKYIYYRSIEKNADLIVTLTTDGKQQWKKAKKVVVIPNFSSMVVTHYSNCDKKRVIAVGRLCEEKGFKRLLAIWKLSNTNHNDWQLDIFGDGDLRNELTETINREQIKNVVLHGVTKNIEQEYVNSSICVVTSYYEEFSMVILEAMKHGVPCIAFDCPVGPRNLIKDKECGYLVQNGDILMFTEKLNQLMDNDKLRAQFSKGCLEQAKLYDTDKIMKQWKHLFEKIT